MFHFRELEVYCYFYCSTIVLLIIPDTNQFLHLGRPHISFYESNISMCNVYYFEDWLKNLKYVNEFHWDGYLGVMRSSPYFWLQASFVIIGISASFKMLAGSPPSLVVPQPEKSNTITPDPDLDSHVINYWETKHRSTCMIYCIPNAAKIYP